MKRGNSFYITIVSLTVFGALGSGCGVIGNTPILLDDGSSAQSFLAETDVDGDQDANCSSGNYNVKPLSGSEDFGVFSACAVYEDAFKVKISGVYRDPETTADFLEERLCVLPAQFIPADEEAGTESQWFWKPNSAGNPMAQCKAVDAASSRVDGLEFRFDLTNFNIIFVVNKRDLGSMQDCLKQNQPDLCPSYSRGRFRE